MPRTKNLLIKLNKVLKKLANNNQQQNTTSARNAFNHRREYSANPYIGGDT